MIIYNDLQILNHAKLLTGFSIEKLSIYLNKKIPNNINYDKGIMGKLIQSWFNISFNCNSILDIPTLGLEIKTIMINNYNLPINNVFITNANLFKKNINLTWRNSNLRKKILKILWIPIINKLHTNYKKYLIGNPFIWVMNNKYENILKLDWYELTNIITLGKINNITIPLQANYLSLQRKSNKKNILTSLSNGKLIYSCPYGFYFKKIFLKKIIKYII